MNAFSVNWKYEFNWLYPPISLIAKVIKHMQFCNGQGVLLVPRWESAYYWPILNDGQKFYPFVKGVLVVNPFFVNGTRFKSVFSGRAKFNSLVLYLKF